MACVCVGGGGVACVSFVCCVPLSRCLLCVFCVCFVFVSGTVLGNVCNVETDLNVFVSLPFKTPFCLFPPKSHSLFLSFPASCRVSFCHSVILSLYHSISVSVSLRLSALPPFQPGKSNSANQGALTQRPSKAGAAGTVGGQRRSVFTHACAVASTSSLLCVCVCVCVSPCSAR